MSQIPDYYAILEVHPTASKEVIDVAYRKLAGKHHPDVNRSPDAAERMKRLNEAYEVLSDPAKRATYDRYRREYSPALSQGNRFRTVLRVIGIILVILIIGRLRILGAVILAIVVLIWLLYRTKR